MYYFDVEKATKACIAWVKEFFEENGKGCNAVLGISGGKDSSVTAAILVEALGKDRVIGVLMPNGEQADIDMARALVSHLGIKSHTINIHDAVMGVLQQMKDITITEQTKLNLPPRIRMSTLYAVSQSMNGRVANTCNLSEDYIGYSTRYGDSVGDFSPLSHFTVTEVKQIGTYLGLPDALVHKIPSDGLTGKSDEDIIGFSYDVLDRYIREGICEDDDVKRNIDTRHRNNLFKLQLMPAFLYQAEDDGK